MGVHGERDRRHILERVLQLAVGVRIDRQHRRRREQHHAAVGRRVLQRHDPELSAGAGAVLDDDGAGVRSAQPVGHLARHDVGGAAGRKADDDPRRLEPLRARGEGKRTADEAKRGGTEELAACKHATLLLIVTG